MHKTALYLFVFFGCIFFQNCDTNEEQNITKPSLNQQPSTSQSEFYLGGIQVNEEDNQRWINTLKKVGMNTVEVTVYLNHSKWNESHVFWNEEEKWVVEEIRAAKKAGLKVVLILRTTIQHFYDENKFLWHGMILPKGEKKLKEWFVDYQSFALQWAKICEQEGVEILGIGSEMNALTATQPISEMPDLYAYYSDLERQRKFENRALKYQDILKKNHLWVRGEGNYESLEGYLNDRISAYKKWVDEVTFAGEKDRIEKMNNRRQFIENQWIALISEIRKAYNGKLTYAANFDNYMDVGFWEHLDFIGINAYFQLRDPSQNQLSEPEMKSIFQKKWETIFDDIEAFKISENITEKPVLFTELGYVRAEDSTLAPWQGFGFSIVGSDIFEKIILWDNQPLKPKERQFAVEALSEAVNAKNFDLAGILYWKLTTHPYHLNYEPFALHISDTIADSLQLALVGFLKK